METETFYPFPLVAEAMGVPLTTARYWFDHGALGDGHYLPNGKRSNAKLLLAPCGVAALGMAVVYVKGGMHVSTFSRACAYLANMPFSEFQRLADERSTILANEPGTETAKQEPIRIVAQNERIDFSPDHIPVLIAPYAIEKRVYQALEALNQLLPEIDLTKETAQ